MKNPWYKTAAKFTVLFGMEILLNIAGLDDLADCLEFVFNHDFIVVSRVSFSIE